MVSAWVFQPDLQLLAVIPVSSQAIRLRAGRPHWVKLLPSTRLLYYPLL
jgi:hypothetical protein